MIRAWLVAATGVLSLLVQPAEAQQRGGSYSSRYDTSVAMVDLRFGQEITGVEFSDDDEVTDFENGFLLIDILGEFLPNTIGGGRLGWSSGTGDGRAASQGMNMRGFSLGVVFDGRYPLGGERLFLVANGNVQYTNTYGSTDTQDTEYSWWSLFTRLGLGLSASRVALRGGLTYRNIDGKERTRGDVDRTTSFEIDQRDSAFVEFDLSTSPGGHVGASFEGGGGTEGWFLYFRRFF